MTPLTRRSNAGWLGFGLFCAGMFMPGCVQQRAKPLTSDAFLARREEYDRSRVQPVDQPGPLTYEGSLSGRPTEASTPPDAPDTLSGVSPTVTQSVRPVPEEGFQLPEPAQPGSDGAATGATTGPTTSATDTALAPTTRTGTEAGPDADKPARADASPVDATPFAPEPGTRSGPSVATTQPSGSPPATAADSSGGYQVVGTVLADVNSAPIFADKVLGVLDRALAAAAREMDERRFRNKAAELIAAQVNEYIAGELEFALAKSRLENRDKQLASAAAIRWREEQITKAGGSQEVARQQWAARGQDFEEQVEEQYRTYMVQLYYQRKEYPKVHVSAEDKRRYYQENLAREFSQPDRARFRVIMVAPGARGGRQQALGEINRLLDRARSGGADFAELANGKDNDNPSFRQPAGWIARGAFVVPEVEQAVWNLRPGQISDIIETPSGFYIARLEELQPGRVLPFTDPAVQKGIENTLSGQQFKALRRKAQQGLIRDAIIRYHPDERGMLRVAVEMAAQKYKYWRTARS